MTYVRDVSHFWGLYIFYLFLCFRDLLHIVNETHLLFAIGVFLKYENNTDVD